MTRKRGIIRSRKSCETDFGQSEATPEDLDSKMRFEESCSICSNTLQYEDFCLIDSTGLGDW